GYNANFLLNVGPMPTGAIQPEFVTRLNEIGDWMKKNGETIYETRGGPFKPRNWGAITEKGSKYYVHVLDWQDDVLALPKMANIKSAQVFGAGTKVNVQQVDGATLLHLPAQRDSIDTIIVLER